MQHDTCFFSRVRYFFSYKILISAYKYVTHVSYLFNSQQLKSDESFLTQLYDKLIAMTGKKGGVPMLVGEI